MMSYEYKQKLVVAHWKTNFCIFFFSGILRLNLDYLFKVRLVGAEEVFRQENETLDEDIDLNLVAPVLLAATGRLAVNAKPFFSNGKVNHFFNTL